jgi:two-component system CheB/CheR fusion protein
MCFAFPGRRPLSVLIADPHEDGAESLASLLRLKGYDVAIARTGPEALAAAAESPPDVLIVEPRLPGLDGWEVAPRLRARVPRTLCIAVSTLGRPEDRRRSAAAGIALHLVKPVDPAWLLAILAAHTRSERDTNPTFSGRPSHVEHGTAASAAGGARVRTPAEQMV